MIPDYTIDPGLLSTPLSKQAKECECVDTPPAFTRFNPNATLEAWSHSNEQKGQRGGQLWGDWREQRRQYHCCVFVLCDGSTAAPSTR